MYRVSGPNGDSEFAKFSDGSQDWFSDFPKNGSSIGGRFENFIFCSGEHLTILTESFLKVIMGEVGFVDIKLCSASKTTHY